ncbi:hypothetical protein EGW08_014915, partial [Elysia chlorotica]
QCGTINEILAAFHLSSSHALTPREFSYLCPAIIYHLDHKLCRSDGHDHEHLWGFSCVAVLIISLVGLLGVAVIPIMQKVFYNHLLQFLVALAIGALSGDALLHLLPHAIMSKGHGHSHDEAHSEEDEEEQHRAAAFKGLMAFSGILFFFITERLLTIITVIKRNKKSEKHKKKKRCEKYCDIESNKKSVKAKLSHRQLSDDGCDKAIMVVHPNKEDDEESDAQGQYAECSPQGTSDPGMTVSGASALFSLLVSFYIPISIYCIKLA